MKLAWISLAALTFTASGLADQIAIRPNSYAAIAYSPSTGKYRYSFDYQTQQAAADAARARLATADARIVCWTRGGFCALALGDDRSVWGTGWRSGAGASNREAMDEALAKCKALTTNVRVAVCISTDGQYVYEPKSKAPDPEPPAGQGPTISALELTAIDRQADKGRTVFTFSMTITPGPSPLAVEEPWFWIVLGGTPVKGTARAKIAAELKRGRAPVRIPGDGYVVTANPCDRSTDPTAQDRWIARFGLTDAQLKGPDWTIMGKAYPLKAVPLTFVAMDEKDNLSDEATFTLDATRTSVQIEPPGYVPPPFAVGERVMVKRNGVDHVGTVLEFSKVFDVATVEILPNGVSERILVARAGVVRMTGPNPEPNAVTTPFPLNPEPAAVITPFPTAPAPKRHAPRMPMLIPDPSAFYDPPGPTLRQHAEPVRDVPSAPQPKQDASPLSSPKFAVHEQVLVKWQGASYVGKVVKCFDLLDEVSVTFFRGPFEVTEIVPFSQVDKLNPNPFASFFPLAPRPTQEPADAKPEPPAALRFNPEPSASLLPSAPIPAQQPVAPTANSPPTPPPPNATAAAAKLERATLSESDPEAAIGRIVFSPDDRLVAVAYSDSTIRFFNAADGTPTGKTVKTIEQHRQHAFMSKGASLVTMGGASVETFDVHDPARSKTFMDLERLYEGFAVQPDGAGIALAALDRQSTRARSMRVDFLDPTMSDPQKPSEPLAKNRLKGGFEINMSVSAVAFSPDGRMLAINGKASKYSGRVVELWNVERKERVAVLGVESVERMLAFSPDGAALATGRQVWDVQRGALRATLKFRVTPRALAYDPKGQWIAIGGDDRRLALCDPATGEKKASFRANDRSILSVAVSHDGSAIATSGRYETWEDSVGNIWNTAAVLRMPPNEADLAGVVNIPLALTAFELGSGWTFDRFASVREDKPQRRWGETSEWLAEKLGVALPELPPIGATTGDFLKGLFQQGATMGAEIKRKHGPAQERLFELGVKLALVGKLYRSNAAGQKPIVDVLLGSVVQSCRDLSLPDAVCRRLSARIAANAPEQQVFYECAQVANELLQCLPNTPADQAN